MGTGIFPKVAHLLEIMPLPGLGNGSMMHQEAVLMLTSILTMGHFIFRIDTSMAMILGKMLIKIELLMIIPFLLQVLQSITVLM